MILSIIVTEPTATSCLVVGLAVMLHCDGFPRSRSHDSRWSSSWKRHTPSLGHLTDDWRLTSRCWLYSLFLSPAGTRKTRDASSQVTADASARNTTSVNGQQPCIGNTLRCRLQPRSCNLRSQPTKPCSSNPKKTDPELLYLPVREWEFSAPSPARGLIPPNFHTAPSQASSADNSPNNSQGVLNIAFTVLSWSK